MFPGQKPHAVSNPLNLNPQMERAIADILLNTIQSERYVLITAKNTQREHIISCGILLVTAGIEALRRSTEFLGKAIEICRGLASELRNRQGQFAEVCKILAGQLDNLALYFENVIKNFQFLTQSITKQAAYLNTLKDHYLDLKDPAFVQEFQIFKRLCHLSQDETPWKTLGSVLSSSSMGPVIGVAMSMCIEKTATAALDLILTRLKPTIDRMVQEAVRRRVMQEPRLGLMQKKDIDRRLVLLFEISLYEDLQDILGQIALGIMRYSNDWRMQLLTLSFESILTLQAICICTDQVCDNFLTHLPIPKARSNTEVYSIEELTQLISAPISQILYNKILILTGRVVTIIPQALYRQYQENKERARDQKEIEFTVQRLEYIDTADKKAAENNRRCVHDAVAETLGLNSKQLADASGLGAPERGAFKTDIRKLYLENTIETERCSLKEAFSVLRQYQSDRGIACFEEPNGTGHAVAFYCKEGQLRVRDCEKEVRLEDYQQHYGYSSVELIIPREVNARTLSAIQHAINLNRITRAADPMSPVDESEDEAFRLGMPKKPKLKKAVAGQERSQIETAIHIDQGAIPTVAQKNAIIATLAQEDWRLPNDTDQDLDGRGVFRCDHAVPKKSYEIQKNNMKGRTTVAVVHYPVELWRVVGTNQELDNEVHDIIKQKLVDSLNRQEKIYLKLENFPKIFEHREKKYKHHGIPALIASRATEMDCWLDYSKNALIHLLELRLKASLISPESVIIMRPRIIDSQQLDEALAEIVPHWSHQDDSHILLLPLLIQKSEWVYHWVGVVIEKQGTYIHITYLDSENQAVPTGLEEAFTQELEVAYPHYQIQFLQGVVESQRYNNCGPELIENFIQYLTGNRVTQEEAIELHQFLGLQDLLLQSCTSGANTLTAVDEKDLEKISNARAIPVLTGSLYSFFSMYKRTTIVLAKSETAELCDNGSSDISVKAYRSFGIACAQG